MEELIGRTLEEIQIEEVKAHHQMAVAPLFFASQHGPNYLTLSQGFENGDLIVQEISEGGSVPDLSVTNNGNQFVLLLDGEEIRGAKQNRALNTSVLVAPKARIIIPVSCTEQGRWNYTTKNFEDSGVLMARLLRSKKQAAVTRSVRETKSYRSDQGEVWEDVASLHSDLGSTSGTGAMRDAYESRKAEIDDYIKAFSNIGQPNGIAVFLGGQLAGLDLLSYSSAMENLLPKIIGSYAMDALRIKQQERPHKPSKQDVRTFLAKAGRCTVEAHASQGHGEDARLVGKDIQGAALIAEETVIHMALFSQAKETNSRGGMTSFSRRRNFKTPLR